ncbi:hypothetical protein [Actinoplanes sp. HUAS TT8]|uniref:hypothetical protein n=1 Tax=Actinoplanes sp. HUAS TT8 TaxID=3447453 RepID=UPI003F51C74E
MEAKRTRVWRLAGLAAGLVAAAALAAAPADRLGLGLALAAPAFALCLLAGVIIGELTALGPAGPTRIAGLKVRRAGDYLPRRMTRGVAALTVLAAAFFTTTGLTADADDRGRAGRAFTVACGDLVTSASPWPGRFYSLPIGAAILLGLAAAAFALRAVIRRPALTETAHRANAGTPAGTGPGVGIGAGVGAGTADDDLRRTSARTITAACGVLVTAPLAGSALFAAGALGRAGCPSAIYPLAHWTALALAGLTVLAAGTFTARTIR